MIELKIENVAETLINQAKLFNCTLENAWNNYMHSYITEQFTLEDVANYIEDMEIYKIIEIIEERDKNDNGIRYSLDDLKNAIK